MTNYSTSNRDNNFNILRLFASIFVLYNHSFILAGLMSEEPLWKKYTSMVSFGNLGVDIFFITSGFLLALSLLAKQELVQFFINRVLRIFPGLVVSLVVTVVTVGLFFTALDFFDFIGSDQTKHFLIYNSILLKGIVYLLPEAFQGNPIESVNGSLWTLPHELKAYIALFLTASASLVLRKYFANIFKALLVVICAYCYFRYARDYYVTGVISEKYRLYFFFLFGACMGAFIKYIKLDMRWAIAFLALVIFCLSYKKFLFPVYTLLLPYIILTMAYIPSGKIRKFNIFGDYSYGMYIYGFFVQQCVVAVAISITPHMLFLYSFFVTLIISVLSWHFIESPALRLKGLIKKLKVKPSADDLIKSS